MKALNELGISTLPWHLESYKESNAHYVISDEDVPIVSFLKSPRGEENARLMSESPKLYECLLEAVTCKCAACGGYDTFYCKGTECQVKKWREVLDNVSGERK